jgi:hypothetical protein
MAREAGVAQLVFRQAGRAGNITAAVLNITAAVDVGTRR